MKLTHLLVVTTALFVFIVGASLVKVSAKQIPMAPSR